MGVLFGESVRGAAGYAPLVVRVLAGVIMAAHGWQKLQGGPSGFGQALAGLGVPLPGLMAYVVTFVELIGGVLLIVGLLSRLAALLLTIDLVVAILLVKVNIGLLSPADGSGVGAELDLALIAGFLVVLLAGPGRLSVDQALGYEVDLVEEAPRRGGGVVVGGGFPVGSTSRWQVDEAQRYGSAPRESHTEGGLPLCTELPGSRVFLETCGIVGSNLPRSVIGLYRLEPRADRKTGA